MATPVNLRYLTGFTGSNGAALLAAGERSLGTDAPHRFFTDFRYTTQAAEQVRRLLRARDRHRQPAARARRARCRSPAGCSDSTRRTRPSPRTSACARRSPQGWQLRPCAGAVERLRAVKDAGEIERLRAAAAIADEALSAVLEDGLVGRSEREVALDLELRMRRLGAEAPSFPSIVAAGANGGAAARRAARKDDRGDVLVTIDWGARHEGYSSDCTRTYATGEGISEQAREVYELVLAAQQAGLAAVKAGPSGREVDAVAREVIEAAGHGERFGHGLGHGVGLEVHEAPRLSRTEGDSALQAGNVVTVEPGVYLPGQLGVRIEDLLVVTPDGYDVLNGLDKALTVIS